MQVVSEKTPEALIFPYVNKQMLLGQKKINHTFKAKLMKVICQLCPPASKHEAIKEEKPNTQCYMLVSEN